MKGLARDALSVAYKMPVRMVYAKKQNIFTMRRLKLSYP
jgi:hypothetical protein